MFGGHPYFETAAGSVAGRAHSLAGKPSQDAYVVCANPAAVVAVVADGCGSADNSEVGAWIGASALARELLSLGGADLKDPAFWEGVQASVISTLRTVALAMGGDLRETARRFFLFTLVGAVIAKDQAAIVSFGDGLVILNGKAHQIGPFPGNAPPYLGHALTGERRDDLRFVVHRVLPAAEVSSIVVATDGAQEWREVEKRCLPGTTDLVGPIEQLWENDRFFEHPDTLRRKLARMNRNVVRPLWDERRLDRPPALLDDDTTVAVIRAKKERARLVA